MDKSIQPRQRYGSIIESYYYTKIEQIDFRLGEQTANQINDWVSQITENHIQKLVSKGKKLTTPN